MYRYYEGNGYLSEQKKFLDIYFTESYWRDSDFFFYVLSLDPIFSIKFDILRDFLDADTSHLYEKSTDK